MEWEFTPAELVRGEAAYGLSEFRRDLGEEIRRNIPGLDDPELDRLFRLIYDLHYWLATGNDYRDFESQFADQPKLVPLLRAVHAQCTGNVEMLGAILQRLIMDGVEGGAPLEQALDRAAQLHERSAAVSPLERVSPN
ncbi:hypothetical protein [Piscinibacter sp.]|jgi:hypothetical protein|uniref:hypothetical protein n=1 Tax=Piscinibacter sp. TaxID=1903157 RepID=UPI00355995B0